jgi:hypothetical protein
MMDDLKPCPFCGGPPSIFDGADVSLSSIGCANIDCDIEPSTDYLSWDESVTAWNRRAKTPAEEVFERQIADYVRNIGGSNAG